MAPKRKGGAVAAAAAAAAAEDEPDDGSNLRDGDDGDGDGDAEARERKALAARKSRHQNADRLAKAKQQLAARDAKHAGKRRIDSLVEEVNEDDQDVLETVTDAEYKTLVGMRRDHSDFVENDGVHGYDDDGEEFFDQEKPPDKKQRTGATSKVARTTKKHKAAPNSKKINSMFLKARPTALSKEEDKHTAALNAELAGISKADDEQPNKTVKPKSGHDVLLFGSSTNTNTVGVNPETVYESILDGPSDASFLQTDDDFTAQYGATPTKAAAGAGAGAAAGASSSSGAAAQYPTPGGPSASPPAAGPSKNAPIKPATATATATASHAMSVLRPAVPMTDDVSATPSTGTDWFAVAKQTEGMDVSGSQASVAGATPGGPTPGGPNATAVTPLQNGKLAMYWFDAYEDTHNAPGMVYVFGKALMPNTAPPTKPAAAAATATAAAGAPKPVGDVKRTESVCVRIGPIRRSIYVLPRPYKLASVKDESSATQDRVSKQMVKDEIALLLKAMGCTDFGVAGKGEDEMESKKYCFEQEHTPDGGPSVPPEAQYLQVTYSAKFPALPIDLKGKTFSRVFGTRSTALERFLLERGLMGPRWLIVDGCVPAAGQFSYSKFDYVVAKPSSVELWKDNAPESPPFKVLSLSLRTILNPKTHRNEVVMVSGLMHQSVSIDAATANPKALSSFTVTRPPDGVKWPVDLKSAIAGEAKANGGKAKLQLTDNETGLLQCLCAHVQRLDPDVLVGHELHGYTLEVLLQRMQTRNVSQWSKLGRLKKNK